MGRGTGVTEKKPEVAVKARAPQKKTLGELKRERVEETRRERQAEIKEQVADGSLVIRQATDAERASW